MIRNQSNICKYLEEKCWSHFFMSHLSCYDQSWVFTGRTDVEAKTTILWPLDAKSWLIWKDPDAGKDWRQKGTKEDEMVGWHHRLNGHGFRWTLGVGDGQGGLVCCRSWGHRESDMTVQLNWTEIVFICAFILHCLPSLGFHCTYLYKHFKDQTGICNHVHSSINHSSKKVEATHSQINR